ncbi:RHS repeat-associated core domain-containing protein [Empedobacter brevis]|uniref:RHS repeat-associated core domain-containing protein n=1 Tax=Empedobacter brevis TaxID=247 RepID=UPI0025777882|nr:RHS repeat-associated core domain-containing protein [Empedobacter brevis]
MDGFQYKDGVLQFFPTTEGYVNAITAGSVAYNYVYNLTDHLGNVRVSYAWDDVNSKLKTVNEDHYYPFGLQHKGYNKPPVDITIRERERVEIGVGIGNTSGSANYKYRYNGKELQEELNLNLYDYGARNYDPALGRWFNIDPASEISRRNSPYVYALNNPVFFIDPDGMVATPPDDIYLNGSGKEIHRVKNDQPDRTFIVKTTETRSNLYSSNEIKNGQAPAVNGISKNTAKQVEAEIKNGNVNSETVQNNIVQIENISTMKEMYNIVKSDNGSGGTSDTNNREYGGTVSNNGTVTASEPGAVANPKTNSHAEITNSINRDTRATFHSHPSGQIREGATSGSGTIVMSGSTTTYGFQQSPSSIDVKNAGNTTGYVFGRENNTVTIYNSTGVVATMPDKQLRK